MAQSDTTQEVTTTNNQYPQQVVRTTTTQVDSKAQGEDPQKKYEKQKRRRKERQFIWYILIVIEVLLALRFILKASSADPFFGFPRLIYAITNPFVYPFSGISGNFTSDEWATAFAGIVYLCIAWGLIYLLHLIYPISPAPKDFENSTL